MDEHVVGEGGDPVNEPVILAPIEQLAQSLAEAVVAARQHVPCTIAVAESLTGGQLAAAITACDGASEWFRGSIVAYHSDVKHGLLQSPSGSVVTAETAIAMAETASTLLESNVTVALTGVGGPGSHEGEPAGTVYLALSVRPAYLTEDSEISGAIPISSDNDAVEMPHTVVQRLSCEGSPLDVMRQTLGAALEALREGVAELTSVR